MARGWEVFYVVHCLEQWWIIPFLLTCSLEPSYSSCRMPAGTGPVLSIPQLCLWCVAGVRECMYLYSFLFSQESGWGEAHH